MAALKKKSKKAEPNEVSVNYKYTVGSEVVFAGNADTTPEELQTLVGTVNHVVGVRHDVTDGLMYQLIRIEDKAAYTVDPSTVDVFEAVEQELTEYVPQRSVSVQNLLDAEVILLPALQQIVAEHDNNYLETSRALFSRINENFFLLGGVLAQIKAQHLYLETGKDWKGYIEDTFGYKVRKAEYYIYIYQAFSRVPNFDLQRLSAIGWSKAAAIARYVNQDNAEELLATAESMPFTEVKKTLETTYTDEGAVNEQNQSSKIAKTTFTFRLFEDQANSVQFVLEEAKRHFQVDDLNDVFEQIVLAWGNDYVTTSAS